MDHCMEDFKKAAGKTPGREKNAGIIIKEVFLDFCASTSVHGAHYIGDRKRLYERILWISICLFGLTLACILVAPVIFKWNQSPIELGFESHFSSLGDIHFPGITICPQRLPINNKFNYTEELDYANKSGFHALQNDKQEMFQYMTQICSQKLHKSLHKITTALEATVDSTSLSFDPNNVKDYLLPSIFSLYNCNGVVKNQNDDWNCESEFKQNLLDEGFCYTFNMLSKEQILRPGIIYNISSSDRKHPYKVYDSHEKLELVMHSYQEFNHPECDFEFAIYIHNPTDLPWEETNKHKFKVSKSSDVSVSIRPTIIKTDANLKKYKTDHRNCFFEDEHPLKYFITYSKKNCDLECFAEEVEKICNCLPSWLPHLPTTPLCNLTQTIFCVRNIQTFSTKRNKDCNCLSDCNSVTYEVKIDIKESQAPENLSLTSDYQGDDFYIKETLKKIDDKKLLISNDIQFNHLQWNSILIDIYYDQSEFLAMKRFSTYTFSDFLSQLGGIFGGIMGFSLLSFLEIIYFATIHFYEKMCQRNAAPEKTT